MAETPSPTAVLACAVIEEELSELARGQQHLVRLDFIEQGLHNEPARLRERVQEAVTRAERETACERVVLGYGLCSRGTEGIRTRRARLVVPRAHDCITLLLGSRERYAREIARDPGTYWHSPGWNRCHTPPGPERYEKLREQYRAAYGEDNAEFLLEHEMQWMRSYDRAAWVDVGVAARDEDIEATRCNACWLGWRFERLRGDPELMRRLVQGPWSDDAFLTLEPGEAPRFSGDENVIEPAPRGDAPASGGEAAP